jgi:hypothetical protein
MGFLAWGRRLAMIGLLQGKSNIPEGCCATPVGKKLPFSSKSGRSTK